MNTALVLGVEGQASDSEDHLQPDQVLIEVSGRNQCSWVIQMSFMNERKKFKNRCHL